jgi:hypothetical protein
MGGPTAGRPVTGARPPPTGIAQPQLTGALGNFVLAGNLSGSSNSGTGISALRNNTTGSYNSGSGALALYSNTTGSYNTGSGSYALSSNSDGSYNTALGYSANSVGTTYNNSTGLGYNADCTASNQVRVGNSTVTEIGGVVNWSVLSDGRFKSEVREDVVGLEFVKALRPVTYHQDLRAIDDWWAAEYGERDTSLMQQNWITGKSAIRYSGFIAQEVEETAKTLGYDFSGVDAPKNDKDFYGLRYSEFTVPLVKAVQELAHENELMHSQNLELQDTVERLEVRLAQLETLVLTQATTAPEAQTE